MSNLFGLFSTLIIKDSKVIKQGPSLPRTLAGHCLVHIEDRYFMVIGGIDSNSLRLTSPASFYVNYQTGDYLELPYMKLGRANHACLTMKSKHDGEMRVIIVTFQSE